MVNGLFHQVPELGSFPSVLVVFSHFKMDVFSPIKSFISFNNWFCDVMNVSSSSLRFLRVNLSAGSVRGRVPLLDYFYVRVSGLLSWSISVGSGSFYGLLVSFLFVILWCVSVISVGDCSLAIFYPFDF